MHKMINLDWLVANGFLQFTDEPITTQYRQCAPEKKEDQQNPGIVSNLLFGEAPEALQVFIGQQGPSG